MVFNRGKTCAIKRIEEQSQVFFPSIIHARYVSIDRRRA